MPVVDNFEWSMRASKRLTTIVVKYMDGIPLSDEESAIMATVVAEIGPPPMTVPSEPLPELGFEIPGHIEIKDYGNSGTLH